jgi:hypothetical protein
MGGTVGISELLRIADTLFTDNSDAPLREPNPPGDDKALLQHQCEFKTLESAVTEVTPFQISSGHSPGVALRCTDELSYVVCVRDAVEYPDTQTLTVTAADIFTA